MKLTQEEIDMVMAQRNTEAQEVNAYAEPTGYERGTSMLGQVLRQAINEAIESGDEAVADAANTLARHMEDTYESWDKVIEDTSFVDQVRTVLQHAAVYDDSLVSTVDMVDSAVKDMQLSDEDFKELDEQSRNNMKDPDEWGRKTSNVDGQEYVVNNNTGEYYTAEEWDTANTQEMQPHTLGWQGEEGVENASFTESLPEK